MSAINQSQDYDSLLPSSSTNVNEVGLYLSSRKSSGTENKKSGVQEVKSSRNQELKKDRVVVDENGQKRRPVNITMRDDIKLSLDILAAKRRVRLWEVMNEALEQYLEREQKEINKSNED